MNADGLVDKVYNLWNRNPIEITSAYLASNGTKDVPPAPNIRSGPNVGSSLMPRISSCARGRRTIG